MHQIIVRSHADGIDGVYSQLREKQFSLDVISLGGVTMFMLHVLLTLGKE